MIIEMGKKYRTRYGRPVTVLTTSRRNRDGYTVVALIHDNDKELDYLESFFSDGRKYRFDAESNIDLIEVEE